MRSRRDGTDPELSRLLAGVALRYPRELLEYAFADIERTRFHIDVVRKRMGTRITVCDVGGSISLFSAACAALGMRAIVVDRAVSDPPIRRTVFRNVHAFYGVEVIERDVVRDPPSFSPGSLDVVASFGSIEHWHGSPKPVLHALRASLRPGGMFFLGTPNCVNLRKRLTVPFGHGRWCSIEDWYEAPIFLSHVHEPDVDELRYIAEDLRLEGVVIVGRNWIGHAHPRRLVRLGTRLVDRLLQLRPSLCSDIYVVGHVAPAPPMPES